MAKNPFTLMYGITSQSVISRSAEVEQIIKAFTYQENMYSYLITGIRGSGKTVLLKTIETQLSAKDEWIIININPQSDIISSLAGKLFASEPLRTEFKKWKLSITIGAITLTRDNGEQTSDPEIMIMDFMERIRARKMKVLISIDEVNDTPSFRSFINFYQTLIGKNLPVYLLLTALNENVSGLINDKAMTFLSRAPKIELEPLNLPTIAKEYEDIFNIDRATAIEMAKLTKGYAFAYQVMGYLFFEASEKRLTKSFIDSYDKYLWNNGYNKFWKDRTENEKLFLIAMSESPNKEKSEIIAHYKASPKTYPIYRERLLEQGLIYSPSYGKLDFVLPRFEEFVSFAKEFE